MNYLRPLANNLLAEEFVRGVLGFSSRAEVAKATNRIMMAEVHLATMSQKSTLRFKDFRSTECREEAERAALRLKIFRELSEKVRLDDDGKIRLGKGGALSRTAPQRRKNAYFVSGLPASGKSAIADQIADAEGAVLLDSDYAKRKFPEFAVGAHGASILHEESAVVVFGDAEDPLAPNLKGYCISEEFNVVVPKIGHDEASLLKLGEYFRTFGYTVHLTLVSLDRQQATRRAYERFVKSKRYVPLSLIFDVYSNNPALTYYQLKERPARPGVFASFGKISTDVPFGAPPLFVEATPGNPARLFAPPALAS